MDENKREDANIIVYRAPDGGSAVKFLARDGSVCAPQNKLPTFLSPRLPT